MQATKKVLASLISTLILSGCSTLTPRDIDTLPAPAALPDKSEQGRVDLWLYDDVTISSVDNLDGIARYPDNPDEVSQLSRLEITQDRGDFYVGLVRGYITAPGDGQYRFFLGSDDDSRFLLSTSASPADAQVIASVPGWARKGEWNKYSSQTSGDITLFAGNRYYFEVRYREARGADHFSVAWEGPGVARSVIDGQYLSSFAKASPIYPDDELSIAGYELGYRVGFFDGKQALPFVSAYPPLDKDQDGLYDNWETFYGLDAANPNDANSDGDDDILANFDEFRVGSNPSQADSDGDGIPDGVEFAYGLDPLNPSDAQADFDNDGFSNLDEYQAGTDLTDSDDVPLQTQSRVAGIWAQYFSGKSFNKFVMTKVEPELNFSWGAGSPAPEIPIDNFSARYFTQFTAPHDSGSRDYQVVINRDDGFRMDFDGERIVEAWTDAKAKVVAQITANAGQSYPVNVEYYESAGHATLSVQFIDTVTGQVQNTVDIFSVLDLSNPANQSVDNDGDGIPDIWEYEQGTNSYVSDAAVVNNTAGISNLKAFQSGLNPWTAEAIGGETVSPSGSDGSQIPPPIIISDQSSVTITWVAPLERSDGQSMALSDIQGYELSYGKQANSLNTKITISGEQTSHTIEQLDVGTWYFRMRTFDYNDFYSAPTDVIEHIVK
jgi:hypothetical protein